MGATPADSSQAAIEAYLLAETYKQAPWVPQSAAPREAESVVSIHGKVMVWQNDTQVASAIAAMGSTSATAMTGSMAVKDFYDNADMLIGQAVMLKVAGDALKWVFYCKTTNAADAARCNDEAANPFYGDENSSCNQCHFGQVYSMVP